MIIRPKIILANHELLIATLLRWGVSLSLGLVALGTALTFRHHANYLSDRAVLSSLTHSAGEPQSWAALGEALRTGSGQGVVTLGLGVLIATPVLRVVLAFLMFWCQKDLRYTRITAGVLALLAVSLMLGRGGG